MQVWSKSINLFRRYCVGKPNLISFHGLVTLKMRSRSPKSNQFFPPPNHVSMQVWSKSIHWFKRYRVGKKLRGRRRGCGHGRRRRRDPHQKQYVPHLRLGGHKYTYCPLDVCSNSVTRVDVAGTRQLLASKAYLNSSSQTTCSKRKQISLIKFMGE